MHHGSLLALDVSALACLDGGGAASAGSAALPLAVVGFVWAESQ